jgi:methanethiol S-methyltransferase
MGKEIFIVLVIVCVITHVIRSIYEILKHKEILKPNRLSFVIMFVNMILLWISWVLLCSCDTYKINLPAIIRYTGLFFSGIGIIVFITAIFTLKALETYEGDLVTTGIFSKIRHPMYLGFVLWLIGFPVFFGALFSLILSLLFISNILFWRFLEEKDLIKRFPTYLDFKNKTIF